MKSWIVDDALTIDSELAASIDRLRELLEDVIGPSSASLVDACWSLSAHRGKKTVTLTLSDWTSLSGVQAHFEPNELSARADVRSKFIRLWGDLLQERNHQQIRELLREGA
jgi:hypothetical protein